MSEFTTAGVLRVRALQEQVWAELREGKHIVEAFIAGDETKELIYGLMTENKVYVNPALPTVEILIHELLHRLYPRWGETRVQNETRRIIRLMDNAEIQKWHRAYKKVVRVQKKSVNTEAE